MSSFIKPERQYVTCYGDGRQWQPRGNKNPKVVSYREDMRVCVEDKEVHSIEGGNKTRWQVERRDVRYDLDGSTVINRMLSEILHGLRHVPQLLSNVSKLLVNLLRLQMMVRSQRIADQINGIANPAFQSIGALDVSTKHRRQALQVTSVLQRRDSTIQLLCYLEVTYAASPCKEGKIIDVS